MNRELLLRKLLENHQKRQEYLDSMPQDARTIFHNQYVDSVFMDYDRMLETIFAEHTSAIDWFLYDWKPGDRVGGEQCEPQIHSIDEFIYWLKVNEGFDGWLDFQSSSAYNDSVD